MQWLTGPNVILALKIAVSLVTLLLACALWAVWRKKFQLHGRINLVFVFLTVTTLIFFEVAIRVVKPDIYDYIKADPLLYQRLKIHLWFSIPAAIMMPFMLWSGLKRRAKVHRAAAVLFLIVWTLTFLTGVFFLPHKAAAQELSSVYFHSGGRKVQVDFPGSLREMLQGNPEYIGVLVGQKSAPARISKIMIFFC